MIKQILKRTIFIGLFLIPFVPFLVSGQFFFPFITTKAFAFRIIVEVIFASWILLAITDAEYRPRKSLILYALGVFLAIVGLANIFGVEPVKSFWSNFERMEGYVTMLHLGALFLVMGSFFKEREWTWWWNTTLAASALMIFYSIFQLLGTLEIHQGGARVDGTLGNAAYLALYFLVHIFVAIYIWSKNKIREINWLYALLIIGQVYILYSTATRGAILGLLGGLILMALLNIRNKENKSFAKWSKILLTGIVVLIAVFLSIQNTKFVQESPVLNRFSNLTPSSWRSEGRAFVWPIAIEGIKERPLLGWGQENFNYVFAEHYQAEMFRIEPWFDRAHNIFLDWGIAAGLLGLLSYLSLYGVLLLVIWKNSTSITHTEKTILTGLLGAYFINNFFVFDNLVSYVMFIAILAYMHSKVNEPMIKRGEAELTPSIYAPVLLVLVLIIYFVNIKPINTNSNLILALQASNAESREPAMDYFKQAYESSRLGRPEVVEWISSSAVNILSDEKISMEKRNQYFQFAKKAVEDMTVELKGDPRYEVVAGTLYSATGFSEDALKHLKEAQKLMPEKQNTYFNLGQVYLQEGKYSEALGYFKTAYELAPEFNEAHTIYILGAIYAKDTMLVRELINKLDPKVLLSDNRILALMYQTEQMSLLRETLYYMREKLPENKNEIDELMKQL